MFDKYLVMYIQEFLKKCSKCNKCDILVNSRYCYCCRKYFCNNCEMKWYYTHDEVMGRYCLKCYDLVTI